MGLYSIPLIGQGVPRSPWVRIVHVMLTRDAALCEMGYAWFRGLGNGADGCGIA